MMQQTVRVATCNLNQHAMDFDGNLHRVAESIRAARAKGARLRTGPELELSGYGCEDHFFESDTVAHCWESLLRLLDSDLTDGMLVDVGMPVLHRSARFNCRVLLLDRRIVAVRPKMSLAQDGNYRESRWFTAWRGDELAELHLPRAVQLQTGQSSVPFGNLVLRLADCSVAIESCEEVFVPENPHVLYGLNGVDIVLNGSGSHFTLRKIRRRLDLVLGATARSGGVYVYANQQGCDGGRLYYDGCSMIASNGQLLAQGSQFSVLDVEVLTADVDLAEVHSYRAAIPSRGEQAMNARRVPEVRVEFALGGDGVGGRAPREQTRAVRPHVHPVEEEIALGPACWLWDYLRRSGATGFFLPLSGGADSAATAALVGVMCSLVVDACAAGVEQVVVDARRVAGEPAGSDYVPTDPRELCARVLHTCYMGTSNSSRETCELAARLAGDLGAYHLSANIDRMVAAVVYCFEKLTGKVPRYRLHGGSIAENLALQNIQARLRMVFGYMLAQLLPWVRGRSGFLLVLGSANVDEALRGYMTKYDCSSADINPIGGVSKQDLKRFLLWAGRNERLRVPSLLDIVKAPPTAELEPITDEYRQSDEVDMGMTYEELGVFGRLRKMHRAGPVSMFEKLNFMWAGVSPSRVADKVKRFFRFYAINRHKLTTLTPSVHAEDYAPDDNRFDHRQFLYNVSWKRQFDCIDRLVDEGAFASAVAPGTGAVDDPSHSASADTLALAEHHSALSAPAPADPSKL